MMVVGRSDLSSGADGDPARSPSTLSLASDPGTSGPLDDRTIVAAVLDGDQHAFRLLVERDGPSVVRACQRILGDLPSAEDAAQEAFVTAYRSLAAWRADGPFGAWLSRIAVRIALREAGKRSPVAWRSVASDDPSGMDPAVRDAVARDAVSARERTDPALLSMQAERATDVRRAVIELDEPYREVVALRFFAGRSLDEIATQTGRPLGTVKTHLHRGLARLRTRLDEGSVR
jgi:RNA polymerase sigma-70 factor, ECF subfamily